MEKTKVIVDSTADFPPGYEDPDLAVVPVIIKYQGQKWNEFEFNNQFPHFFRDNPDAFIQTSQPSPGAFIKAYTEALQQGYDKIITITIASKLSGVYDSASLAANMLSEEGRQGQIFVVDSKSTSAAQAMLAMNALAYLEEGHSAEETADYITKQTERARLYAVFSELEHLMKSGRLGIGAEKFASVGTFIDSVLKLHFFLSIKEGDVLPAALPVRKLSDALEKMVGFVKADGVKTLNAALLHADDSSKTSLLEEKIRQNFNIGSLYTTEINKALRGHAGKTVWAITYLL